MTRIVGVHGIRNYRYYTRNGRSAESAAAAINSDWRTWLSSTTADLRVSYYAHLLHRGTPQGAADDPATLTPTAQEILVALVDELLEKPVRSHGERTARARAAADWLSRHFGGPTHAAVLAFCREVDTYLTDQDRRARVRAVVATTIREHRPSVVIAHSLGSVVAYETLWAQPELSIDLLITIGSPLALPGVVYERLMPDTRARPPGVSRWVNLADKGDIVAIPRGGLDRHFAGVEPDHDVIIDKNGFHSVRQYLGCIELRDLLRDAGTG